MIDGNQVTITGSGITVNPDVASHMLNNTISNISSGGSNSSPLSPQYFVLG